MSNKYGGYDLHEFAAEFYDTAYDSIAPNDINFFIDCSRKANGRTLELACGTGRILIPTAISGIEITGLDLTFYAENMPGEIGEATRRSAKTGDVNSGKHDRF